MREQLIPRWIMKRNVPIADSKERMIWKKNIYK